MFKTFEVANIRCGGCVNTITTKLAEAGFKSVDVDLSCEPRKVTVDLDNEALEAHFIETLRKLGYPKIDEESSTLENVGLKAKSFISCAVGKFELSRNKK